MANISIERNVNLTSMWPKFYCGCANVINYNNCIPGALIWKGLFLYAPLHLPPPWLPFCMVKTGLHALNSCLFRVHCEYCSAAIRPAVATWLEITRDYWRLLEITRDYWKLLNYSAMLQQPAHFNPASVTVLCRNPIQFSYVKALKYFHLGGGTPPTNFTIALAQC